MNGGRITGEEVTALIPARDDGSVQVGKGDRIEVDSIVEQESVRLLMHWIWGAG